MNEAGTNHTGTVVTSFKENLPTVEVNVINQHDDKCNHAQYKGDGSDDLDVDVFNEFFHNNVLSLKKSFLRCLRAGS